MTHRLAFFALFFYIPFSEHYGKEDIILVSCIGDSIILPDPNNCAYYFRCEFRKPVRHECATDTLYDVHAKTCNFNQFVECYSDVTCPAPFGLFPHPFDCRRYINCYINIPYIQECAPGNLYDAPYKNCNETRYVNCQDRGLFVP